MRNIIVFIIICAIVAQAFSQEKPQSKTEAFANQTGVLIEKKFIELGYLDQADVRLQKMKNLSNRQTAYGMRFEYLPGNEVVSNVRIAYIDSDEMDELVKAIAIIHSDIVNKKPKELNEITFVCRSGLVVGYFFDITKNKWILYIQLQQGDSRSTIKIGDNGFKQLLDFIKEAKAEAMEQ